jgi:hypothetical protein
MARQIAIGEIITNDQKKIGRAGTQFEASCLFGGHDLPSKKRGGAFLLIGFMALGGFVVERGFIAEGRV